MVRVHTIRLSRGEHPTTLVSSSSSGRSARQPYGQTPSSLLLILVGLALLSLAAAASNGCGRLPSANITRKDVASLTLSLGSSFSWRLPITYAHAGIAGYEVREITSDYFFSSGKLRPTDRHATLLMKIKPSGGQKLQVSISSGAVFNTIFWFETPADGSAAEIIFTLSDTTLLDTFFDIRRLAPGTDSDTPPTNPSGFRYTINIVRSEIIQRVSYFDASLPNSGSTFGGICEPAVSFFYFNAYDGLAGNYFFEVSNLNFFVYEYDYAAATQRAVVDIDELHKSEYNYATKYVAIDVSGGTRDNASPFTITSPTKMPQVLSAAYFCSPLEVQGTIKFHSMTANISSGSRMKNVGPFGFAAPGEGTTVMPSIGDGGALIFRQLSSTFRNGCEWQNHNMPGKTETCGDPLEPTATFPTHTDVSLVFITQPTTPLADATAAAAARTLTVAAEADLTLVDFSGSMKPRGAFTAGVAEIVTEAHDGHLVAFLGLELTTTPAWDTTATSPTPPATQMPSVLPNIVAKDGGILNASINKLTGFPTFIVGESSRFVGDDTGSIAVCDITQDGVRYQWQDSPIVPSTAEVSICWGYVPSLDEESSGPSSAGVVGSGSGSDSGDDNTDPASLGDGEEEPVPDYNGGGVNAGIYAVTAVAIPGTLAGGPDALLSLQALAMFVLVACSIPGVNKGGMSRLLTPLRLSTLNRYQGIVGQLIITAGAYALYGVAIVVLGLYLGDDPEEVNDDAKVSDDGANEAADGCGGYTDNLDGQQLKHDVDDNTPHTAVAKPTNDAQQGRGSYVGNTNTNSGAATAAVIADSTNSVDNLGIDIIRGSTSTAEYPCEKKKKQTKFQVAGKTGRAAAGEEEVEDGLVVRQNAADKSSACDGGKTSPPSFAKYRRAMDILKHPRAIPYIHQMTFSGFIYESCHLLYGNAEPITADERFVGALGLALSLLSVGLYYYIAIKALNADGADAEEIRAQLAAEVEALRAEQQQQQQLKLTNEEQGDCTNSLSNNNNTNNANTGNNTSHMSGGGGGSNSRGGGGEGGISPCARPISASLQGRGTFVDNATTFLVGSDGIGLVAGGGGGGRTPRAAALQLPSSSNGAGRDFHPTASALDTNDHHLVSFNNAAHHSKSNSKVTGNNNNSGVQNAPSSYCVPPPDAIIIPDDGDAAKVGNDYHYSHTHQQRQLPNNFTARASRYRIADATENAIWAAKVEPYQEEIMSAIPQPFRLLLVPTEHWAKEVLLSDRCVFAASLVPKRFPLTVAHHLVRSIGIAIVCAVPVYEEVDCVIVMACAAFVCFAHAFFIAYTRCYRVPANNFIQGGQSFFLGVIALLRSATVMRYHNGSLGIEGAMTAFAILLMLLSFFNVIVSVASTLIEMCIITPKLRELMREGIEADAAAAEHEAEEEEEMRAVPQQKENNSGRAVVVILEETTPKEQLPSSAVVKKKQSGIGLVGTERRRRLMAMAAVGGGGGGSTLHNDQQQQKASSPPPIRLRGGGGIVIGATSAGNNSNNDTNTTTATTAATADIVTSDGEKNTTGSRKYVEGTGASAAFHPPPPAATTPTTTAPAAAAAGNGHNTLFRRASWVSMEANNNNNTTSNNNTSGVGGGNGGDGIMPFASNGGGLTSPSLGPQQEPSYRGGVGGILANCRRQSSGTGGGMGLVDGFVADFLYSSGRSNGGGADDARSPPITSGGGGGDATPEAAPLAFLVNFAEANLGVGAVAGTNDNNTTTKTNNTNSNAIASPITATSNSKYSPTSITAAHHQQQQQHESLPNMISPSVTPAESTLVAPTTNASRKRGGGVAAGGVFGGLATFSIDDDDNTHINNGPSFGAAKAIDTKAVGGREGPLGGGNRRRSSATIGDEGGAGGAGDVTPTTAALMDMLASSARDF